MSKLTTEQHVVLAFFDAHDAAAMRHAGKWVWADDIRNNPALATSFIKHQAEEYRDMRAWLAPIGKVVRQ